MSSPWPSSVNSLKVLRQKGFVGMHLAVSAPSSLKAPFAQASHPSSGRGEGFSAGGIKSPAKPLKIDLFVINTYHRKKHVWSSLTHQSARFI